MKINFYKDGIEIMSSEKQLILIIITAVAVFGWQLWKDKKKKHDEKLQRHLSKYFDSKW